MLVPVDVIATKEETYKEYQADTEPCLPGWEVSIYNVYIINQFKPLLLGGRGGNKLVMVTVNGKEENS